MDSKQERKKEEYASVNNNNIECILEEDSDLL